MILEIHLKLMDLVNVYHYVLVTQIHQYVVVLSNHLFVLLILHLNVLTDKLPV